MKLKLIYKERFCTGLYVNIFTVPLEIFRCEQLAISNENSWRLLLLMSLWRAYQSGFDHKFVNSRAVLKRLLHRKCMGKFKPVYLLIAWVHRSAFFLNVSGIWRASWQCKFITEVIQGKQPVR